MDLPDFSGFQANLQWNQPGFVEHGEPRRPRHRILEAVPRSCLPCPRWPSHTAPTRRTTRRCPRSLAQWKPADRACSEKVVNYWHGRKTFLSHLKTITLMVILFNKSGALCALISRGVNLIFSNEAHLLKIGKPTQIHTYHNPGKKILLSLLTFTAFFQFFQSLSLRNAKSRFARLLPSVLSWLKIFCHNFLLASFVIPLELSRSPNRTALCSYKSLHTTSFSFSVISKLFSTFYTKKRNFPIMLSRMYMNSMVKAMVNYHGIHHGIMVDL